MSSVLDYQQCPQCKFEQADFEYKCRTFEEYLQCRRCGYSEVVIREGNSEGQVTYKHKINEGAGVLFYRWKDAIGFMSYCLATSEEVTEAEEWLRKKMDAGDVDSDSSYLARWNGAKKAVEFVIGTFYEFPAYDPDQLEVAQPDLRRFALAEEKYTGVVRYICGHIAVADILLLQGQKRPQQEVVYQGNLACPACVLAYPDGVMVSLDVKSEASDTGTLKQRDGRLWENRALDGSNKYVTPAVSHPATLEEAASLFYAAFPEKKRMHPQSTGFQLQLEGWSDEDIEAKKWLCDCDGCRAYPISLGCMSSRR